MKNNPELPTATAQRVPMYYRYLKMLEDNQVQTIKSKDLSKIIHVPSATIRRDFSCFGELGRSGFGYDVTYLRETFGRALDVEHLEKIALIGVGNLGMALIRNNFRRNPNLKITAAFEKNPELTDKIVCGIPVYDISLLKQKIQENQITTAITTVPSSNAEAILKLLDKAGIRSVLNFAPERLNVPKNMTVRYIDLTSELQTLVYLSKRAITDSKDLVDQT